LFSFAFDKPTVSEFTSPDGRPYSNPPEVREAVKALLLSQGQVLFQRVLTGMMFIFPGDCFPDASGVMMTLFEVLPHETGAWLESTLQMLPPGSMKPAEAERLLKGIAEKVQSGETRKIRVLLQGSSRAIFQFESVLFLTFSRFHQLLPPPQRRPPRRPWPPGGDTIPIQRMRPLLMCTIFFLSFILHMFSGTKRNPRSICTTGVGPFPLNAICGMCGML